MSGKTARRRRATEYFRQPYVVRLQEALASGALAIVPGTMSVIEVAHDRHCPLLASRGPCSCKPELAQVFEPRGR